MMVKVNAAQCLLGFMLIGMWILERKVNLEDKAGKKTWTQHQAWRGAKEGLEVMKWDGTESTEINAIDSMNYVELSWIGTSSSSEECFHLIAELQFLPESPKEWCEVLQQVPVTRHGRAKQKGCNRGYDPGRSVDMENHCFYACLWWTWQSTRPTRRSITATRAWVADTWRCSPHDLLGQARSEGLTAGQYLAKHVWSGWGGTPELSIMDAKYSLDVIVVGHGGEVLWASKRISSTPTYWLYQNNHFQVLPAPCREVKLTQGPG